MIAFVLLACAASNPGTAMPTALDALRLTLDGTTVDAAEPDALREAVLAYNRGPNRTRTELPDDLNVRCLRADEVIAFVAALGDMQLPESSSGALELSAPELGLRAVDGFGLGAINAGFTLANVDGRYQVMPQAERGDAGRDLEAVHALLVEKRMDVDTALAARDALPANTQAYYAANRLHASALGERALVESTLRMLLTKAAPLAATAPVPVGEEMWDAARFEALARELAAAQADAPAIGGMPGGMPGR